MIYNYLFYYLRKFFKLVKSDDYKYFDAIAIMSVIIYLNVMSFLLIVKAFDFVVIPSIGILETVFIFALIFSFLYFRYGYKNKYKIRVNLIENSTQKQKKAYIILTLIYLILSLLLPFLIGDYFNISLLN